MNEGSYLPGLARGDWVLLGRCRATLMGFAADVERRWAHPWASRLRHVGRGRSHTAGACGVRPATGCMPWSSSRSHRATGLPWTLPMHWTAGIHAKAVAHARPGATVVGTWCSTIVRRPWVVTWR